MNIKALTADLDAVFQRHGITGNLQICMQVKDVLDAVTPEQFGRLMHMFLEELTKAGDACQCPSCATKRTSTHGSLN